MTSVSKSSVTGHSSSITVSNKKRRSQPTMMMTMMMMVNKTIAGSAPSPPNQHNDAQPGLCAAAAPAASGRPLRAAR